MATLNPTVTIKLEPALLRALKEITARLERIEARLGDKEANTVVCNWINQVTASHGVVCSLIERWMERTAALEAKIAAMENPLDDQAQQQTE